MSTRSSLTPLMIKFLVHLFIAWIAFGFFQPNPFRWIFLLSLMTTILLYGLGDSYLLPRFGTFNATLADGSIAVLLTLLIDGLSDDFTVHLQAILVYTILVLIFEYIFHHILKEITNDAKE